MTITFDQLLATLAVDEAEATVVAGHIVIIQRDPQPLENNISRSTDINLLIVDLDADPLSAPPEPAFTIYVENDIAGIYGDGTFVPTAPWDGTVVVTTSDDPFVGWYVSLQQPSVPLFESEQEVTVKVDFNLAAGYGHAPYAHFPWGHSSPSTTTSFEYTFTIEDVTPPKLLSAVAMDQYTVRLAFDDQMAMQGAGSVLDVDKWIGAITRHNVDPLPGVQLEVISITQVDDSNEMQFDLTVNWEMTQGCQYRVTASEYIEDSSGNAMDSDALAAWFVGYSLPLVQERNFDHWRMMVPLKNRQEDATRDLERFSNCIQETLLLLLHGIDSFTDQFDPDAASDDEIDEMLSDMGNPFDWAELVLSQNERRKLLRYLIDIYKLKGTAPGIEGTVRFLLDEQIEVVDYAAEGWVLGEDELGNGSIAEVACEFGEPYDFSSEKSLQIIVDGYKDENGEPVEQAITFEPAQFVVPSAGLASEVVAVINEQLQEGGAYVVALGTSAVYTITGAPFALSGGENVQMVINGTAYSVIFHVEDFAISGSATAGEVANRLQETFGADVAVSTDGISIELRTIHTGADASMRFVDGTALAALGVPPGDETFGTDAKRVAIYSKTSGVGSVINIIGGAANEVFGFDTLAYGGTGGSILAPEESYTLYCFDIETQSELDEDMQLIVRRIAEYMKPAHTHLESIRTALPLPWPGGWTLGVSELDVSAVLTE